MTLAFDPNSDFADVADRQQNVTLSRPGTSDAWNLSRAVRSSVRASEARASGGKYTEEDVVWHLDATEWDDSPRPGDVILEANSHRWTVLTARRTSTGRWRCVCRDLAIEHGLDQYIDIEVATLSKDAAGAESVAWRPWRTGVRARVQPVRSTIDNDHDQTAFRRTLEIYTADQLTIDHTHRIKTPDGMVYRVVGCRNAERIDALVEIEVEQEGLGTGD